jgi:O-antigen/teichoic acid export membrane protein
VVRLQALVARNTAWNLVGALLPIPVALVCIPLLVSGLGVERFGVLALAWMLLGYFGMFDFGLAQSTTRFVSSAVAGGVPEKVRALGFASILLHSALGLIGGAVFALLAPWLAASVFNLPTALVGETRTALYWLAASVPAMVITAALRGMLEGLQRFDVVNLVRIPASMVNYAGPAIALYFGTGLPLVVAVIVVARFAVLAAYALACLRALPQSEGGGLAKGELVALASYGGWLTASNLVNPLIIAADRFIIAATVSVAAVAFYVTPYEVITKIWILSASLLAALFPVFSGMAASDRGSIRAACRSAELYLLAVASPVVILVLGSADLLLEWWLGGEFREQSTAVAQLLALGILVNVVAQVPLTALNAMGRADVTTRIALFELPVYVLAIWYGAARYGINGVAAIWAARAVLDALALFLAAHLILPKSSQGSTARRLGLGGALVLAGFLLGAVSIAYALPDRAPARFATLAILLVVLVAWEWRMLLGHDDRKNFKDLCSRLLTDQAR